MESAAAFPTNAASGEQLESQLRQLNALARQAVDCGVRIARLNTRFTGELIQDMISTRPGAAHRDGTLAFATAPRPGLDAYIADFASIIIDMQTALRAWMAAGLADGVLPGVFWLAPYAAAGWRPMPWRSSSGAAAPLWFDQIERPARTQARATPSRQGAATGSIHDRRT